MRAVATLVIGLSLGSSGVLGEISLREEEVLRSQVARRFLAEIKREDTSGLQFMARNFPGGFPWTSPGAALERLGLGPSVEVFVVGLQSIRQRRCEELPIHCLRDVSTYLYPVIYRGSPEFLLRVGKRHGIWYVKSFGEMAHAQAVGNMQVLSGRHEELSQDWFEVHVPALNLVFLGSRFENDLMLVPLQTVREWGLIRGERLDAREAFRRILPAALSHNGLPR